MAFWNRFSGTISLRQAVAVLGFAINLLGLLGGALYVAPAQQRLEDLTLELGQKTAQARAVVAADETMILGEQMCALAFSVSLPSGASDALRATMRDLYMRSIARRHDAARTYIAALGAAGAVDFAQEWPRYQTLAGAEAADFNWQTYQAVNAYLPALSMRMSDFAYRATMKTFEIHRDRKQARNELKNRQMLVTLVATLGSALLTAAALASASPGKTIEKETT
jgi:hypothetical protein